MGAPRRAAMAQEEKNGDDPGGKYVLRHDEISDKRPEVHGYRQLRGTTKEDTNSGLKKSKAPVSLVGKMRKRRHDYNHVVRCSSCCDAMVISS